MHTDIATLGFFLLIGSLYIFSEKRNSVDNGTVLIGLCMQVFLASLTLNVECLRRAFLYIGRGVMLLRDGALAGAQFVFGYLGGGAMPFEVKGNTFIFFFQALPVIFVVGALSMLLFHWGIMQKIVSFLALIFRKTLKIRGALAVCSGAKMFLGQTDAPMLVQPYLKHMTRSEIFATMCMGMATTSATVLVLYASILESTIPDVFVHLITSTVMSIPGALAVARILVPSEEKDIEQEEIIPRRQTSSAMEAIGAGMYQAKDLVVAITLSLMVFIALMFLVNKIIGLVAPGCSMERIIGYVMTPFAWLLGFSGDQAVDAGSVLGQKIVFNEIFAFNALAKLKHFVLNDRLVLFYACNGFANIASVGIVVSAWNVFVPKAKAVIPRLAVKALAAGVLVSMVNAIIVRLVLDVAETVKAL